MANRLKKYFPVLWEKEECFDYSRIKTVYLIVIYEKSPKEFKKFPDVFYHRSKQVFNSGLELNLLQEYIMIPLDIYHKNPDNNAIETPLDAWLTFLSDDRPEKIIALITKYPEFKPMYETLYRMCRNVERVMNMVFSEELRIMDNNTVQYMIDEQAKEIEEKNKLIDSQAKEMGEKDKLICSQAKEMEEMAKELERLRRELENTQKSKE